MECPRLVICDYIPQFTNGDVYNGYYSTFERDAYRGFKSYDDERNVIIESDDNRLDLEYISYLSSNALTIRTLDLPVQHICYTPCVYLKVPSHTIRTLTYDNLDSKIKQRMEKGIIVIKYGNNWKNGLSSFEIN